MVKLNSICNPDWVKLNNRVYRLTITSEIVIWLLVILKLLLLVVILLLLLSPSGSSSSDLLLKVDLVEVLLTCELILAEDLIEPEDQREEVEQAYHKQ